MIAPPAAGAAASVGELEMWAGSAAGGLWHTEDGGGRWQPVRGFTDSLSVSSLALHVADDGALTLYAGTGEGFGNEDAVPGNGIYLSTDRGASCAA